MFTNERSLVPLHSSKNRPPSECGVDNKDRTLLMFAVCSEEMHKKGNKNMECIIFDCNVRVNITGDIKENELN